MVSRKTGWIAAVLALLGAVLTYWTFTASRTAPVESMSRANPTAVNSVSAPSILFGSNVLSTSIVVDYDKTLIHYFVDEHVYDPDVPGAFEIVDRESLFSTSYQISRIAGRHANEFFVAGRARNGETVIEKFIIPTEEGGYYTTRMEAETPIGVPVTPSEVTVFIGPSPGQNPPSSPFGSFLYFPYYRDPDVRGPALPPIREEVFRGSDIDDVLAMAADPEGRFLIVVESSGNILQVTLYEPVKVTLLHSPSSIAELSQRTSVTLRHHASEGRIYDLTSYHPDGSIYHILLKDPDNDGAFDPDPPVFTDAEFRASAYGDASSWSEDFLFYKFPLEFE